MKKFITIFAFVLVFGDSLANSSPNNLDLRASYCLGVFKYDIDFIKRTYTPLLKNFYDSRVEGQKILKDYVDIRVKNLNAEGLGLMLFAFNQAEQDGKKMKDERDTCIRRITGDSEFPNSSPSPGSIDKYSNAASACAKESKIVQKWEQCRELPWNLF
jgi:hypothetical protein